MPVYANDMRVSVSPEGLYTYPDLVVTCGEERYRDDSKDTLLNPMVVIEVLSESTESYDRGGKFEQYRRLESLAEYVLVSQSKVLVERFVRNDDGTWLLSEMNHITAALTLDAIGCTLELAEIYDRVEDLR